MQPALHLTLEESFWPADVIEPAGGGVDAMEIGEGIDDHLGELAVGNLIPPPAELRRHCASDHDSLTALHDEERSPHDREVGAEDEGPGRRREAV
jgi:hypothetical protein